NPYITILGPVETAAKRISIMGICNKFAGALAPIILGYFLNLSEADKVQQSLATMGPEESAQALDKIALQVVNPYIGIVVVLIILAVWISRANLPEVKGDEEEDATHHNVSEGKQSIFDFPHVILGFICLFLYVGVEVLAGDTIIAYGTYLGIPLDTAKFFTSFTMVSMVIGYIVGIVAIPKYLSQETALKLCAILGAILTVGIVFTDGMVSLTLVGLLGLANSLVWPAIWPLALKGV